MKLPEKSPQKDEMNKRRKLKLKKLKKEVNETKDEEA